MKKLLSGRMSGRKTAPRAARASHFSWPMLLVIALAIASCGVKNDLVKPNGERTPRNAPDPSRPPNPIGR